MTQKSFRLIVAENMRFIVQWDQQWNTKTASSLRPTTSNRSEGFAVLLNKPVVSEAEEKADIAFFAQACEVLKTVEGRFRVRIIRRVRIYRLEHLKHHPDAFLPKDRASEEESNTATLQAQENVYSESQRHGRLPTADAIWQYGNNSEIAFGKLCSNALWNVQ